MHPPSLPRLRKFFPPAARFLKVGAGAAAAAADPPSSSPAMLGDQPAVCLPYLLKRNGADLLLLSEARSQKHHNTQPHNSETNGLLLRGLPALAGRVEGNQTSKNRTGRGALFQESAPLGQLLSVGSRRRSRRRCGCSVARDGKQLQRHLVASRTLDPGPAGRSRAALGSERGALGTAHRPARVPARVPFRRFTLSLLASVVCLFAREVSLVPCCPWRRETNSDSTTAWWIFQCPRKSWPRSLRSSPRRPRRYTFSSGGAERSHSPSRF